MLKYQFQAKDKEAAVFTGKFNFNPLERRHYASAWWMGKQTNWDQAEETSRIISRLSSI